MRSMAPERVTVTVRSDLGEDGPLTVNDALRQVLDFFDLLSAAQGTNEATVSWRLVSVSKSSPLQATAEPFAVVPGVDVDMIARHAKVAVAAAIEEITSDGRVPAWMDSSARDTARRILMRNTNGVGRTDIKLNDQAPVIMLVQRTAYVGLATLQRTEAEIVANEPDLSRTEYGSIEGKVADATTFRRHAALRVRDRRTEAEVLCVLSDELAQKTAGHLWREVWEGARIIVCGHIQYNRKGLPTSIQADDIVEVSPRELSYSEIIDPNFTGGLEPPEYLLRDGDVA